MPRSRRIRKLTGATAIGLVLGVVAPLLAAAPAGAAGITTHAWMATEAVDRVTVPELRALLAAHIDQVYAGAQFPDSGYVPGNTYGEEAHWQRFFDAYADIIRAKPDCGSLADPDGPCAAEIAHLMGSIAHGMGDEVWDWLFEPLSADLDEYYLPPDLSGIANEGGQEFQMDLAAIAIYGRVNPKAPPIPSKPDILAALTAAGFTGATEAQLDWGQTIQAIIHSAEASLAVTHIDALQEAMPYLSNNLVTEPGGVEFAARAIAAEWENMWGYLLGDQPPTKVGTTYPADGQRRIPAGGWVRSYGPGSYRDRGGARTRITAALTYALPYDRPDGTGPPVSSQLPDGAMVLRQRGSSQPVALLAGYPRLVPYGPDAGEHTIDLQPAADLSPCTWYEVSVTDKLIDANGRPALPYSWSFRTGVSTEAGRTDGGRCPDDPYTAEERWVIAVHRDLFGTRPTDAQIEPWTYRLDREPDRVAASGDAIASVEHRGHLIDEMYRSFVGRRPTAAVRDALVARLATESLPALRAELLASDAYFRGSGRSNALFVARLYADVLHRPVDLRTWFTLTWQLDRGTLTRSALATRVVTSDEAIRVAIRDTTVDLLGRRPSAAEVAAWTAPVTAADERVVTAAVLPTEEYLARAQR